MMDRDQALAPIIDTLLRQTCASRELLHSYLADWSVEPYLVDGQVAACAIMKGPEIHFAIAPAFRKQLMTRARIREFLAPLLARHGYLTSRMIDALDCGETRFIRRIGFRRTWSAGDTTYFMLTQLPFERKVK